jgi:hypothetical protein
MPTSASNPATTTAARFLSRVGFGLLLVVFSACSRNDSPAEPATGAATPSTPNANLTRAGNPTLGLWELEAARYDDASEFTPADPAIGKLKFIGESHFLWVEYDRKSGQIQTAAGGRSKLSGTNLSETIEFFGPRMEGLMGQTIVFSEELRDGQLHHRGQVPNGPRIEEIWRRPNPRGTAQ